MNDSLKDEKLGGRILAIITERNLSYRDFGRPLGVSSAAVSNWVNDKIKDLRMEHLFAIEDIYGVSA